MPPRNWHALASAALAAGMLLAPMAAAADQTTALTSTHTVQPGETLSQIALEAGVDAPSLATLNGLDDANLIVAGQTLKLPGAASSVPLPAAALPAARTYTIAEGDTLWSIAHQFATTMDALAQLNSLDDADHLSVGVVLTLPSSGPPSPMAAETPVSAATPAPVATLNPSSPASRRSLLVPYTVQAGETLIGIAHQFNVRAEAIASASALDDPNRLSIGTVLKVPLPSKEHVVTAGETLRDIAAAERVDLGSLIDFNQLDDPALIRVGQVVLLPVADGPKLTQPAAAAQATPSATPAPVVVAASLASSPPTNVATPTPAPTKKPAAPKPVAPLAVVTPPNGAPSDGLAGGALKLLGSPYVFGGSSPSGFDCSGFVWYVARQVGKPISRGMLGEYNGGSHPAREELKPGDLVFFQNTFSAGLSHNGIYIGNGQFVHAADETDGVTISSLNTAYWSAHWFGATRLP